MTSSVAAIGCGPWWENLVRVFSELGLVSCVCDTDISRRAAFNVKDGSGLTAAAVGDR